MAGGIQCDVCKRFTAETEIEGWVSVTPLAVPRPAVMWSFDLYGQAQRPIHACSWACVGMLAIKMPEFTEAV